MLRANGTDIPSLSEPYITRSPWGLKYIRLPPSHFFNEQLPTQLMDPFLLYGWHSNGGQYMPYHLTFPFPQNLTPIQNVLPTQTATNLPHPALPLPLPSSLPRPIIPIHSPHPERLTVGPSPPEPASKKVCEWLSKVEASQSRSTTPRTRQTRKYKPYSSSAKCPPSTSTSPQSLHRDIKPEPSAGELDGSHEANDHPSSASPIPPECDGTPMFGNCDPPIFDVYDLEYLPDPVSNPLITTTSGEIKEEIHRLKMHSMHLQREKEDSDRKWLEFKSPETLTEFLRLSASFTKVEAALRYVIRYTRQHNIPIDLEELSYRYSRHMLREYVDEQ